MKSDFCMIVRKLDWGLPFINLHMAADAHIGSQEFDEPMFKKWVKMVEEDEFGFFVTAGDMLNMGLKNSKSNVYEEKMRPSEQKEYLYEALKPIREKNIGACGGNHDYRGVKEADSDPMYDVMSRLQIEENYRQNMCFIKLNLGTHCRSAKKQVSYGIVVGHGASRNKHKVFTSYVDNCDLFVSGHTHENEYAQPSKIRLDMQNEKVTLTPYRRVVCNTFQCSGGYSLRGEYPPNQIDEFQVVRLSGTSKRMTFFTV